jgi:nitrogen regulatory protein PII
VKHIIAYIRPNKLPAVTLALHRLPGLPGMSFSDVRGFSSGRSPKSVPPILQELIDFTPYVRVEVFCGDDQAYEIKYTIEDAARTGNNGDGKIYVVGVGEAIRIQTAEREEMTL